MSPITQQWLNKAAEDFRTMKREHRVVDEPSYNSVCYHAQQCVEKLLKAFLYANSLYFPKTHDIADLIERALPVRQEWSVLIASHAFLSDFATDTRYPGDSAFKEEADEAVAACEKIRTIILSALKDLDQLRLG